MQVPRPVVTALSHTTLSPEECGMSETVWLSWLEKKVLLASSGQSQDAAERPMMKGCPCQQCPGIRCLSRTLTERPRPALQAEQRPGGHSWKGHRGDAAGCSVQTRACGKRQVQQQEIKVSQASGT